MHKRNLIVMNLKTLLPVAENNRPLRNEPRDLIRTLHLKEKKKKWNWTVDLPTVPLDMVPEGSTLPQENGSLYLGTQQFLLELVLIKLSCWLLRLTRMRICQSKKKPVRSISYYIFHCFFFIKETLGVKKAQMRKSKQTKMRQVCS